MKQSNNKHIFTIPNILSFLRLGMIPFIVWLYCFKAEYVLTGILLVLSGLTDIIDGFIARNFNMISDLGKVLDPIADKFTQGAMLLCLIFRFPLMIIPFFLMLAKELFMTISGYIIIKKRNKVLGADWHGKAATVCIFVMMILHVFWFEISKAVSTVSIVTCTIMIGLSFILYAIRNIKELVL